MTTWAQDISEALELLGGVASLRDIYDKVGSIRQKPHPADLGASVRGTLERNSSDSEAFSGTDLYYSVEGIGKGIWGLRSMEESTAKASDIEPQGDSKPQRVAQEIYRILRDTQLARRIKKIHKYKCQLCGERIKRNNGEYYAEAHHIQPLGSDHDGPDVAGNIIILCPNHHVMLDYGIIGLDSNNLTHQYGHDIHQKFIAYHNDLIFGKI